MSKRSKKKKSRNKQSELKSSAQAIKTVDKASKISVEEKIGLMTPLTSTLFSAFFLTFFIHSLVLLTSGRYFHLKFFGPIGHLGHSAITFILLIGVIFWIITLNRCFTGD
jgi:hypothetical protein